MTTQEENVFDNWGQWMRHMYPMAPPTILYFRISNCGNHRQYQLRYVDVDGTEKFWEKNFEPCPNDNHLRVHEKVSIQLHKKELENQESLE